MTYTFLDAEQAITRLMKQPGMNGYALAYCNAYFNLHRLYSGDMLANAERTQITYILGNITHMRGEPVKAIRKFLKESIK